MNSHVTEDRPRPQSLSDVGMARPHVCEPRVRQWHYLKRAARQRYDGHQPRQRKPQPRLLLAALRKAGLVGRRIGHRHGGAVDQLDLPVAPQPVRRLLAAQALPRLAADALDQAQGQPLPRLAIGTVVQTASGLPLRHPRATASWQL